MGEGCPTPSWRAETPQQSFRSDLRQSMNRLLHESYLSDDMASLEVAQAILEKLDIKDKIDDFTKFRDDPSVYQEWKKLGLLLVIDTKSRIDYVNGDDPNWNIKKGDSVLDIHLPPVPKGKATLGNLRESMKLIAEYIRIHNLDSKFLIGVTFEKIAKISESFGFRVVEPKLPEKVKARIERVYDEFNKSGSPMGKILFCYQPVGKFLERYPLENTGK
jgi:hypothetical protein